jgi:hypothetical protein
MHGFSPLLRATRRGFGANWLAEAQLNKGCACQASPLHGDITGSITHHIT